MIAAVMLVILCKVLHGQGGTESDLLVDFISRADKAELPEGIEDLTDVDLPLQAEAECYDLKEVSRDIDSQHKDENYEVDTSVQPQETVSKVKKSHKKKSGKLNADELKKLRGSLFNSSKFKSPDPGMGKDLARLRYFQKQLKDLENELMKRQKKDMEGKRGKGWSNDGWSKDGWSKNGKYRGKGNGQDKYGNRSKDGKYKLGKDGKPIGLDPNQTDDETSANIEPPKDIMYVKRPAHIRYNVILSSKYFANEFKMIKDVNIKQLSYETFSQRMTTNEFLYMMMFKDIAAFKNMVDVFPNEVVHFLMEDINRNVLSVKYYKLPKPTISEEAKKDMNEDKLTADKTEYSIEISNYILALHRVYTTVKELENLRLLNYFPLEEDLKWPETVASNKIDSVIVTSNSTNSSFSKPLPSSVDTVVLSPHAGRQNDTGAALWSFTKTESFGPTHLLPAKNDFESLTGAFASQAEKAMGDQKEKEQQIAKIYNPFVELVNEAFLGKKVKGDQTTDTTSRGNSDGKRTLKSVSPANTAKTKQNFVDIVNKAFLGKEKTNSNPMKNDRILSEQSLSYKELISKAFLGHTSPGQAKNESATEPADTKNNSAPPRRTAGGSLPKYSVMKESAEASKLEHGTPLAYYRTENDFQIPRYLKSYYFSDATHYHIFSMRRFYPDYYSIVDRLSYQRILTNMKSLIRNVQMYHNMGLVLVNVSIENLGLVVDDDNRDHLIIRDIGGLMSMKNPQRLKVVDRYAAPEIIGLTDMHIYQSIHIPKDLTQTYVFNAAVDIHSLGMTFLRAFPGRELFLSKILYLNGCKTSICYQKFQSDIDVFFREYTTLNFTKNATEEEFVTKLFQNKEIKWYLISQLAKRMVSFNPNDRPTLEQVYKELVFIEHTPDDKLLKLKLTQIRKRKELEMAKRKAEEAKRVYWAKAIASRKMPSVFLDGGVEDLKKFERIQKQQKQLAKSQESLNSAKPSPTINHTPDKKKVSSLILNHLLHFGKHSGSN